MSDDELDECVRDIANCLHVLPMARERKPARDRLRLAIDEAVRAEREACAKVTERIPSSIQSELRAARCIAAAIRNRSNTP